MCLELFHQYAPHSCLQIKPSTAFPAPAVGLGEMAAAKAIEERHEQWAATMPQDPRQLWDVLAALSQQHALAPLFSHCAGVTVNAVRELHQPRGGQFTRRPSQAQKRKLSPCRPVQLPEICTCRNMNPN
jgi:ParB family chromosome partitioning protein